MVSIWAPIANKLWARRNRKLIFVWGFHEYNGELENRNPDFRGQACKAHVNLPLSEQGKFVERDVVKIAHPGWKRYLVYVLVAVFLTVASASIAVPTILYGQWYMGVKMASSCGPDFPLPSGGNITNTTHNTTPSTTNVASSCSTAAMGGGGEAGWHGGGSGAVAPYMLLPAQPLDTGCYTDTTRWITGVGQGVLFAVIVMALWICAFRISASITRMENHATISGKKRHFVAKVFTFTWIYYFSYYLIIGLVYVPFGQAAQDWIREQLHWGCVPHLCMHSRS